MVVTQPPPSLRPEVVLVESTWNGLGNRVTALAAAAVVADHFGCPPPWVYWAPDSHCPGTPGECFDADHLFWRPATLPELELAYAQSRGLALRVTHPEVTTAPERWAELSGLPEAKLLERCAARCYSLRPARGVYEKLVALWSRLPTSNPVGVQIRRTDRDWRRPAAVMDAKLLDRLDDLAAGDPHVCFVVASDNPETARTVLDRYPGRAVHTGAAWQQHGIRLTSLADAALDLFALSACRRIVGTEGSTFCRLASWMGGGDAKLELV